MTNKQKTRTAQITWGWLGALLAALFIFQACNTADTRQEAKNQGAVAVTDTLHLQVQYAQNFSIHYISGYPVLHIGQSAQDSTAQIQLALVPHQAEVPAALQGSNYQIIRTPVSRAVAASHTHLAMFEVLEGLDAVVGLTEADYLPHEGLQAALKQGKVAEVGKGGSLNHELVLAQQPQVLIASVVQVQSLKGMNALEQAGITIVPNGDWLEASPLGRAEWLKVFGLLLGKPTKAQACFEAITQRYDSLQRLVKALPPSKPRPLVLTDLPYKGTWYVPAGQSYVATLLKDAGADYPWADTQGTGSLALDFEAVYAKAQQADLWLNTSSARQLADIQTQDPRLANFKPFVQKQVYNNNRHTTTKGGSTYFMQGIVEPHLILADLISIIHPELLPKHQQVYYHQLP